MYKPKKRFQCEQLEPRQMMAGDVKAVLQGGSLYLTEAAGQVSKDNGILVSELANGKIRIQGTSTSGAASKINGNAFQDFTVTGSLFVNFGGGNDHVEFSALGSLISLQTIDLNLGPSSVASNVSDNDNISLTNFKTTGGLSIQTGAGKDIISVTGGTVGNYASNDQLWIKTGKGADYVSIQSTQIHGSLFMQTYDVASENDADTIYIDKNAVVAGNATMRLGGGDDGVYLGDVGGSQGYEYSMEVTGSMTIDTGAGNDTVSIYNAISGFDADSQTTVLMGAGADHFKIDGQYAWLTNLNLQMYNSATENDADMVLILHANFGLSSTIRMGGGADQFLVTDPDANTAPDGALGLTGPMLIDMGAGDDIVFLRSVESVSPTDSVTVRTGAGQDTVNLLDSHGIGSVDIQTYDSLSEGDADNVYISNVFFHNNLNVRMGGGNDQLNVNQSYAFGNISLDTGAGNDTAKLDIVTALDHFMANLGDGNDNLTMGLMWAHDMVLLGGSGIDVLNKNNTWNAPSIFRNSWEFGNGLGWLPF